MVYLPRPLVRLLFALTALLPLRCPVRIRFVYGQLASERMLQSRTLPLHYSEGDLLVLGGVGVLVYYLACLPFEMLGVVLIET